MKISVDVNNNKSYKLQAAFKPYLFAVVILQFPVLMQ